jgi:predicted nuclease of restriction endonuclease-like (RecB) superfamily
MNTDKYELEKLNTLYSEIRAVLEQARYSAYRAVNSAMVQAYWEIGYLIVEHEQEGKERAEYGKTILEEISKRLSSDFGKGFDVTNLRKMRQFYLLFSKRDAVSLKSDQPKRDAMRPEFREVGKHHPKGHELVQGLIRPELSWTHYRHLLRVENDKAREWYMNEAADQHWSTRQLDRQISALYYERLLASREKQPVIQEADDKMAKLEPEDFIHDPYVLEFLDLKDYPELRETRVEQAIIDKLQHFLLELGKGFSFVARQKRIRFEDEDFYIDLVFYNFILKCFVLIDLKIGKLTHQDIGQMDSYVRMYEDLFRVEGDNPTIGLILCSEKNEAIARYSVLNESKQLFASKYMLYLPTEEELERELERERRLIEERQYEDDNPHPKKAAGKKSKK